MNEDIFDINSVDFPDDLEPEEEVELLPGEDMDGDAESALASAGFGTDEDYCHDTPLGDQYGGE
jgi:hypothetical protein